MKYFTGIGVILFVMTYGLLISCSSDDTTTGITTTEIITDTLMVTDSLTIGLVYEFDEDEPSPARLKITRHAMDEINAAGGVNGKPLTFKLKDSFGNDGLDAIRSAEELYNDGVKFILGSRWSSRTIMMADSFTVAHNMLMISQSATSPDITTLDDNNLVWRSCPSDNFQAQGLAAWMLNSKGVTSAAVIHRGDEWGTGAADAFVNAFTQGGGTINAQVSFPTGSDIDYTSFDFTSRLDTLLELHSQAILNISFDNAQIKLITDLTKHQNFINTPSLITSIEGYRAEILNTYILDPAILDSVWAIQHLIDTTTTSYEHFKTSYTTRYSEALEFVLSHTILYDNVYLLALAIEKAALTDDTPITTQMVAAQMRTISGGVPGAVVIRPGEWAKADSILATGGDVDYEGASGSIDFDANGDIGSVTYGVYHLTNTAGANIADTIITYTSE